MRNCKCPAACLLLYVRCAKCMCALSPACCRSAWWSNVLTLGDEIGDAFRVGLLEAAGVAKLNELTIEIAGDRPTAIRALAQVLCAARSEEAQLHLLNLELNQLSPDEAVAIFECFRAEPMQHLKVLKLAGNRLEDDGAKALASTCAKGALHQLQTLDLRNCRIGDEGGSALASILAKGGTGNGKEAGLPHLKKLLLQRNRFGDETMKKLGASIHGGGFPALELVRVAHFDVPASRLRPESIYTSMSFANNKLTCQDCILISAFLNVEGTLDRLRFLWLNDNQIGDVGFNAIASACSKGALANLEELLVQNNNVGDQGEQPMLCVCTCDCSQCTCLSLGMCRLPC